MIDLEFVEGLIRAVDESGVDSIEIERGGTRIRVSKTPSGSGSVVATSDGPPTGTGAGAEAAPAPPSGSQAAAPPAEGEAPPQAEAPADEGLVDVESPMVGTFYQAPSPDSPPYVKVGDRVSEGDTLCIIEAMKLMNELESEVSGTIEEILVEDAEPVEFGQALFRVRPA